MANMTVKIPYGGIMNVLFSAPAVSDTRIWNEKRHCNAEYELHYILQGSCRLFYGKESVTLSAGQMVLITPGIYHSSESTDPNLLRFSISLSPGDRSAQKNLRTLDSDRIQTFFVTESVEFFCREYLREAFESKKPNMTVLTSLLNVIAIHSLRVLGISFESGKLPLPDERDKRNGIIDTFFQLQYAQPRGEEILAAQLGLSKRQLVRILYENYGQSFREKQTAARMDQAAVLLQESSRSIAEISSATGYTSETAFFKQFRNYYHMTPGQYRRSFTN